jgi:hypothetical protein
MKTNQTTIRPLKPKEWAIAVAKLVYEKWQDKMKVPPETRVKFETDLMDYLCNGFVVSRPSIFWMAKIVDVSEREDPGPVFAWFVRVAVGDMRELFETLPLLLPKIAFCRRGDGRIRVYSLERFARLVYRNETERDGEKCGKSNVG